MKRTLKTIAVMVLSVMSLAAHAQDSYILKDAQTEVHVGEDGTLMTLKNVKTGHNYASGAGLWRVF